VQTKYKDVVLDLRSIHTLRKRIMSKIGSYIQSAYDELLHKVTWPSWSELQQTTAIVLVCITIITLLVFLMDGVLGAAFKAIYSLLA
jgi:preprotein translocase subunit SecE